MLDESSQIQVSVPLRGEVILNILIFPYIAMGTNLFPSPYGVRSFQTGAGRDGDRQLHSMVSVPLRGEVISNIRRLNDVMLSDEVSVPLRGEVISNVE